MSDRGYRDEVGAAVERLEALHEENARLRAELDRLDEPKREAARRRSTRIGMLLLGMTFGIGFTGAVSHGVSPHHSHGRHHRHSHSFAPQRIERAPDVRTRAPELTPIRYGDDCSLPYYYDRNNVRHWKPSCLVDTVE
jgi:hypothetical protein